SAADRLHSNFEEVRREAAEPVELKVETGANLIDLGSNVLQGVAASLQIIREVNGRAPNTARTVGFFEEASYDAAVAVDKLKASAQGLFKVLSTGTTAPAVNAIAKVQDAALKAAAEIPVTPVVPPNLANLDNMIASLRKESTQLSTELK